MDTIDLSPYTILLVDDVEFSRSIVAHMLEGMGRPHVHKASNGQEALSYLRRFPEIDIVISDFRMPVMNGLRLLKAIRSGQGGVDPHLPFAMLTGFSDKDLVEVAMALDVNAFIIKPVSRKVISLRLRRMLEATGDERQLRDTKDYAKVDFMVPPRIRRSDSEALESIIAGDIEMRGPESTGGIRGYAKAGEAAAKKVIAEREAAIRRKSGTPSYDSSEMEQMVRRAADVMRHLSCLNGQYDTDLGRSVTSKVTKLISETGDDTARNVVGFLNRMVSEEVVAPADVNAILSEPQQMPPPKAAADPKAEFCPLDAIPPDRALKDGVKATDGSLFLRKGTALTRQVVSILSNLQRLGMLVLERRDDVAGVAVEPKNKFQRIVVSAPPPNPVFTVAQETRVPVSDIRSGETITRDIFSTTGTLYVSEGTELTKRMVALLQDLNQLGRMSGEVWVNRPPEDD